MELTEGHGESRSSPAVGAPSQQGAACVPESGDAGASVLQVEWPDLHSQAARLPHFLIQGSTGSFFCQRNPTGEALELGAQQGLGVPCEKWGQGTVCILRTTFPVSPLLGSGAVETK